MNIKFLPGRLRFIARDLFQKITIITILKFHSASFVCLTVPVWLFILL